MAAQPLPLVDLLLGLMLLATIGVAATRPPPAGQLPGRRLLGWFLVGVPLPLVVGVHELLPAHPAGGEGAFLAAIAAFAVGAVLILARDEDDDRDGELGTGPAPWWPEFERDFRAYARRESRPRIRV